MIMFYFVILAAWAIFLTVWGTTYSRVQPRAKIAYNPDNYVGISITGALLILLFFRRTIFGSTTPYYDFIRAHEVIPLFGAMLCIMGVAFALWARIQSTRTSDNLLPFNPTAYMAYPSYVGIFVGMVGSAIVGGTPWLLIALANTVYLMYRIGYAEGIVPSNPLEMVEWSSLTERAKTLIPSRLSRLMGLPL